MRRLLSALAIALAALVGGVLVVATAARFHDGPIAVLPGGPLRGGELVDPPPRDWSFASDAVRIEFEVHPEAPRSITTSLVVHEGTLYVPSILAQRKRWPAQVAADGRVVVRVEGRRYPLEATRVRDPEEFAAVSRALAVKYDRPPRGELDETLWIFRLGPRSDAAAAP